MAVQEALILLLRASSPLSGFTQVSPTHSFSLSLPSVRARVCVCHCRLLLPPLSSPLIDSSSSLLSVDALWLYLSVACPSYFLFVPFSSLAPLSLSSSSPASQGKVGYSFLLHTKKGLLR